MAGEQEKVVTSDTEGPEKRTREQLKKATISKDQSNAPPSSGEVPTENITVDENGVDPETTQEPVRLQRKRSHEEIDQQSREAINVNAQNHRRKRSRDSSAEEDELNNGQRKSGERGREDPEQHVTSNGAPTEPTADRSRTPDHTGAKRGEAVVEEMSSPKIKRSRLHPDPEKAAEPKAATEDSTSSATKPTTHDQSTTKIPSTSGFANTSASSPFASLAGQKSPTPDAPQTSSSAFAASTFGSLAGSTTPGFGAVGKTSGGFGTGGSFASSTKKEESKESGSMFGGALGQKSAFSSGPPAPESTAFGISASGFGKLGGGGGGFGGTGFSGLGGGGGLTSFASGKPSSFASTSKPVKAFGEAVEDDEKDLEAGEDGDNDDDDAGFKSPLSQESDKQDERFYRQDLETGEEDEQNEYQCRAKLYQFVHGPDGGKEWKERGAGVVKLNCTRPGEGEEDAKLTARLLMRADGSHRVILNTAVGKELKFGAPGGGKPQGGGLQFLGVVDGVKDPVVLLLKVNAKYAPEFYEKVVELQSTM
ncbi:uncharacterized protein LTR77_007590 [Saxophila tyrrhenica]|uniref:RanBD1 domain-containing protein n=1 Tax=Saxophila tyrrhenica TaxID=1690608 RepID=A0AAV9P2Y9_9PEZI|nr:hypothetical protein LTR77_007590 [Saxophila tyrrhenica]